MKPPICRICEKEHWTWQPHDQKEIARIAGAHHAEAALARAQITGTLHLPKRKGGENHRTVEIADRRNAVAGAAHPTPRGNPRPADGPFKGQRHRLNVQRGSVTEIAAAGVTETPRVTDIPVTENQGVTEKKRGRPKGKRTHAERQRDYRQRKPKP